MAKDYNIDDILEEVKKRKEENEKNIKAGLDYADEVKKDTPKVEQKQQPKENTVIEKAEPKAENKPVVKKTPNVETKKVQDDVQPIKEEPKEKSTETKQVEEPKVQISEKREEAVEKKEVQPVEPEPEVQEVPDLIDLNKFKDPDPEIEEEQPKKKKSKKKKIIISVICVILAVLIALGVGAYLYVDRILDHVADNNTSNNTVQEEQWDGMASDTENFEPINEADASEIASLKEMIKKWYYNGSPCSKSHVLNVMLVGEDGYGDEEESRADSAIIASINIDTQTITLTSILRDTYAYWETVPGDETTGEFGKINGAKSSGDITTYINAVEHLYKVKIDNYATVDFESFKTIIDALGGVDIEITQAEINEINNDQKTYDGTWIDKTFEGTSGVITLTGQQALSYCRIRHLDSDNMRADRQKKCLTQIFNGVKDASSVKLLKIINDIVPYVSTDMSRDTLLKVAKYAISQGWMNYDIVTNTVPNSRINENGAGGIYYGAWCWKSDFPQDAYNLQLQLYGKSSITLARTRVDVLKCRESGFIKDGYGPVGATIMNEHYGEASTLPETTTEEN